MRAEVKMLLLFLFMKQSSNSASCVPVPVAASRVSLVFLCLRSRGHSWSWAKPSSPARHSGLIHVIFWGQCGYEPCRVLALLCRAFGCLVWVRQAHEVLATQWDGCSRPCHGHSPWGFGNMSCPKGIFWLTWGQRPLHCAWWTSSTERAPCPPATTR